MRDDDRGLPAELSDAVELLRRDEPVRAEWRDAVLARARRRPRERRISMSVPWAIAAGILCAVGGAGIALTASRGQPRVENSRSVALQQAAAAPTLPVTFSVVAPNATKVSVVGDFNQWNPTTLPMKRSADGKLWEVEVRLPLGRYTYAYLIDGRLAPDPSAPRASDDDFGKPNSVVMVRGS